MRFITEDTLLTPPYVMTVGVTATVAETGAEHVLRNNGMMIFNNEQPSDLGVTVDNGTLEYGINCVHSRADHYDVYSEEPALFTHATTIAGVLKAAGSSELVAGSSNGTSGVGVTSLSFELANVGADRFLVVGVVATEKPVAVFYNGVACQLIRWAVVDGTSRVYLYRQVAPWSGLHFLTVNFSEAVTAAVQATAFGGVDQTNPLSFVSIKFGTGHTMREREVKLSDTLILDSSSLLVNEDPNGRLNLQSGAFITDSDGPSLFEGYADGIEFSAPAGGSGWDFTFDFFNGDVTPLTREGRGIHQNGSDFLLQYEGIYHIDLEFWVDSYEGPSGFAPDNGIRSVEGYAEIESQRYVGSDPAGFSTQPLHKVLSWWNPITVGNSSGTKLLGLWGMIRVGPWAKVRFGGRATRGEHYLLPDVNIEEGRVLLGAGSNFVRIYGPMVRMNVATNYRYASNQVLPSYPV